MNKTNRMRLSLGIFLVILCAFGGYKTYTVLYNQILEKGEMCGVEVEEVSKSSPLQLKIKVYSGQSALSIWRVSVQKHDNKMIILYHLALGPLVNPSIYTNQPYLLTVPDPVNEVQFGRSKTVIWRRANLYH